VHIKELKKSSERIGQLYPILLDHYGRIIDGEHRSKVDSQWRSSTEKMELLNQLGEIYIREGIAVGKIAYRLSETTGMSYRWVAKYLPAKFKDNIRSISSKKKNFVARHASNSINLTEPPKDTIDLCTYKNTNFVKFTLNKQLYNKIERKAEKLETTVINLLYTAILKILKEKAPKESHICESS
jgi:hypothetical protein